MQQQDNRKHSSDIVLILGSGPDVTRSSRWPRAPFDRIVAINNAWAVRSDWDVLITPEDFPPERLPAQTAPHQTRVGAEGFVPAQNRYGGFVLAGGTMAFTAAYWALDALRPKVMAFLGCDMVYPPKGPTHFYGTGVADPLRDDLTLRDLGAKSARLAVLAAAQGCACVNLSKAATSALLFPRATPDQIAGGAVKPAVYDAARITALSAQEAAQGYDTPDGRYWETPERFDADVLAELDKGWRAIYGH